MLHTSYIFHKCALLQAYWQQTNKKIFVVNLYLPFSWKRTSTINRFLFMLKDSVFSLYIFQSDLYTNTQQKTVSIFIIVKKKFHIRKTFQKFSIQWAYLLRLGVPLLCIFLVLLLIHRLYFGERAWIFETILLQHSLQHNSLYLLRSVNRFMVYYLDFVT